MSEDELPYNEIMAHVGELVDEIMAYPDPTVGRQVEELLDWVDVFHREGLGRLIDMVRQWRGELFLEDAARDFVIGTFLETYDLGEGRPVDSAAEEAVAAALEEVRPFVESHGGTIVVDSIVDGIVTVQMLGSCDGCPSSTATLTGGVETALREHWPNFRKLEVVDPVAEEAEATNGAATPEAQPVLLQIRGHEGA
ncbi:MAG TPA: NifU family protein [Acidimicrobiales bacterium]|nr:NifU family protein [Acidimicrobiales bacterium]